MPKVPGTSLPNMYIKRPRCPISGRQTDADRHNFKFRKHSTNQNAFGSTHRKLDKCHNCEGIEEGILSELGAHTLNGAGILTAVETKVSYNQERR